MASMTSRRILASTLLGMKASVSTSTSVAEYIVPPSFVS